MKLKECLLALVVGLPWLASKTESGRQMLMRNSSLFKCEDGQHGASRGREASS